MQVIEYWQQFLPVKAVWYYIVAFVCILIAFLSIIANVLVLIYLLK